MGDLVTVSTECKIMVWLKLWHVLVLTFFMSTGILLWFLYIILYWNYIEWEAFGFQFFFIPSLPISLSGTLWLTRTMTGWAVGTFYHTAGLSRDVYVGGLDSVTGLEGLFFHIFCLLLCWSFVKGEHVSMYSNILKEKSWMLLIIH